MTRKAPMIAASAITVLLAGCAGAGDRYPSLAIRDVERVQGSFESAASNSPEFSPAPPSADLLTRLSSLREQAGAAHAEFTSSAPRAARLVESARGAGTGSNLWADAQVALSDLESIRSRTAIALAEVDILYVDATVGAEANGQIGEVRDSITSLVADEDVTLAALRGQI